MERKKPERTSVLYVRIPESVQKKLHSEAARNYETVANVTRRLLRQWANDKTGGG